MYKTYEINITYPTYFTDDEKQDINSLFQVETSITKETKGFESFVDYLMSSPVSVVISFGSVAIASSLFSQLGKDLYNCTKQRIEKCFSKKNDAQMQFLVPIGKGEIIIMVDAKNQEQIDFFFKNINSLISHYETQGLGDRTIVRLITDGTRWVEGKSLSAPNLEENLKVILSEQKPSDNTNDEEQQSKFLRQFAITDNPFKIKILNKNHGDQFEKMLEMRKKVYIDELHWIENEDSFYDNNDAVYICVSDPDEKNILGSMRILKSESDWMINREFKELLGAENINKTGGIEITRLAVSGSNRHHLESMQISVCLFRGMYRWMTENSYRFIYMVVRKPYFRFFDIQGFCPVLLGTTSEKFGDAVAGKIDLAIAMNYMRENNRNLWQWLMA
uniref:acyl-homoserine-lactone synthase n=1 Tax=Acetivibrio cellulolyticus TaxID=35830 RepID=UPI0001E2D06D|nr:acyl-homoserine-lactone synthase [Acetivibrio cellulolyticus]